MSPARIVARWGRPALAAAAAMAGVVAVTWALEHAMPPPYSGYLAVVVVGFVLTEVYRRQPRQRARRLFGIYLRARARGADEAAARDRLLAGLHRRAEARAAVSRLLGTAWTGPSEKDRVVSGVAALLRHAGRTLDPDQLADGYDRERDRFTIPGWEALPRTFADEVLGRLDEREREHLAALAARYRLFHQRFFARPSALGLDPAASTVDFARLLHSMGNRLSADHPGDAERAYRLSLRLRPADNLAHAGLALLLERTGRAREAAREARAALEVLDAYARRAGRGPAPTEDISPFRSPARLREALERLAAPTE